jgi:hypothetical protein
MLQACNLFQTKIKQKKNILYKTVKINKITINKLIYTKLYKIKYKTV